MKKKSTKSKTTKTPVRNYGWIKQPVDKRDLKYSAVKKLKDVIVVPSKVDLRTGCPEVYDQGTLGSCTANAIGAAHQFEQIKLNKDTNFAPSRLFIYYNERVMEGTVSEDAGAIIRDGLKTVASQGVCPETEWPYLISKFTKKPPQSCYDHALNHQVDSYQSVDCDLNQMKVCLADGYPFVFGFIVYENFETDQNLAKTGMMPMPKGKQVGGHAVMAVGYDDEKKVFIIRNSWGPNWGDKGYFYMPYDFISNCDLASDFWTIRMVETETCKPSPIPTPEPQLPWWKRLWKYLFGA